MSKKLLQGLILLSCFVSLRTTSYGSEPTCVNNLYVENNGWFTVVVKISGIQNWAEERTGRLPSGKTFCVVPGDRVQILSLTGDYDYLLSRTVTIPKDKVLKILCSGAL